MSNYLGRRRVLQICGVYKIENLVNGKVYIGKSNNIGNRWYEHKSELNNGKHINSHLQNAWNKYGSESFKFDIIYEAIDENDALKMEEYFINKFKANENKYGYNLTTGGQSGYLSDESIAKVSNSRIGKYNDLSSNDIKKIKMLAYCYMDLQEISDIYNVPISTIRNIVYGITYKHIFKEINPFIKNVKQQIIDDRNYRILQLYDEGYKIFEIRDIIKETESVVEKCIYKYRDIDPSKEEKRDSSYDSNVVDLYFNQNISTIEIDKLLPISKPKILEIINRYKRKVLGIFPQCKPLEKGALFM